MRANRLDVIGLPLSPWLDPSGGISDRHFLGLTTQVDRDVFGRRHHGLMEQRVDLLG